MYTDLVINGFWVRVVPVAHMSLVFMNAPTIHFRCIEDMLGVFLMPDDDEGFIVAHEHDNDEGGRIITVITEGNKVLVCPAPDWGKYGSRKN